MSKNNFEILTEVYSGTSIGERIKKREQVISDYLNVYGQLILNKVLKPSELNNKTEIYGTANRV